MQFRNLRASELEGSVDIPGLNDWLRYTGATDATVLILAPAGTGKAAAVGHLANRLGRNVILCDLMELFESPAPPRQLANLLRMCEAQRHCVVHLDKLDLAIEQWEDEDLEPHLADVLEEWLARARHKLLEDECTVVFTGRSRDAVPESLLQRFDKVLMA